MTTIVNMSRRDVVKGVAGMTGLVLGFHVAGWRGTPFADAATTTSFAPNVYLAIDETGLVTIVAHRSEMGTGIRTGLPMVLADELEADWTRVTVVQAQGDVKYGDQNTDGSRSMRQFYQPMRVAGASARQMLEAAAAHMWGVDVNDCRARNHIVVHDPTGRALPFGDLAKVAASLPVPPSDHMDLRFKQPGQRRYVGKPVPIVDLKNIVRGKATYGIDVVLPGMKYASVERCPVYGGKVKSFEAADALKVPGVEQVLEMPAAPIPSGYNPLGGIAVIASNTWAAQQGRQKLKIEWDFGPNADYDTTAYRAELEATAKRPGRIVRSQGDVDQALASAAQRVSADYFVPHYAHAPMEVPNAVARFVGDTCETWAPTQNPQGARTVVAEVLGVPETKVIVNVTLLGGGFGRKSKPDYVAEAALLARRLGAPVKVTWTREDEIQHDYYHAISAQHLEAGLGPDGRPTAWLHRTVFPAIEATFQPNVTYGSAGELQQGVTDMPYAIANVRCENGAAANHVRIGWYRSVYNIQHAFAVCSFADELAHAAGKDPVEYLRELLGEPRKLDFTAMHVDYPNYGASLDTYPVDTGRLRGVLDLVVRSSEWGRPLPPRQGRGVAVHRSFLSYAAAIAHVTVDNDGQVSIPRVDVALDCGLVINPDRVQAQLEGAAIMGISNALYSNLTIKQGRVEQSNFGDYLVARTDITPQTHVHIVESSAAPGGVGEPGVPPIAPAICNAIFAATGKRIRALPIDPDQLKTI
ncbi:isoquinoline 1-oxidoreductase, beta subunit [Rhizobiales bacterium GAS191]|nr:isoquinoline 1-oxidoreductase, beta subunit [Rhizobiales bacterium GAS191]